MILRFLTSEIEKKTYAISDILKKVKLNFTISRGRLVLGQKIIKRNFVQESSHTYQIYFNQIRRPKFILTNEHENFIYANKQADLRTKQQYHRLD